jgi:tRNA pseudouridine55 synthase
VSRRVAVPEPHGLLVVDKPGGVTSHDVVAAARRVFGTRRVGHAGTLDPMATGVLVLLLGEATKVAEIATGADKTYQARVCFGRATDSYDADGRTTAEAPVPLGALDAARINAALEAERSRSMQIPPGVSAIKLNGERAYRLARSGTPPVLAARPVRVRSLSLLAQTEHSASLELSVSKGYYVRALARDLGEALGLPAHLDQLRRTQSGPFTLAEACSWPPQNVPELLSLRAALPRLLPLLRLNAEGVRRARLGQALRRDDFLEADTALVDAARANAHEGAASTLYAWVDPEGAPVALGLCDGHSLRVRRGFAAELEASATPAEAPAADGRI